MDPIRRRIDAFRAARRTRAAWEELTAEATRQGCTTADLLFDWVGRSSAAAGEGTPVTGMNSSRSAQPQRLPSQHADERVDHTARTTGGETQDR